jgi:hypothetical protein
MPTQDSVTSSLTVASSPRGLTRDLERQRTGQRQSSHWELVWDQTHVTPEVLNWPYKGAGTEEDPFVVEYIENDRRNPMLFPQWKKWMITILVAIVSSA